MLTPSFTKGNLQKAKQFAIPIILIVPLPSGSVQPWTSWLVLRTPRSLICCTLPFSVRNDAVSELYNMDCVEGMKHYPDNYFDLAIVDPPYGIGGRFHTHHKEGQSQKHSLSKFTPTKWDDNIPDYEYFTELFRVSKNQIIWGGNYMTNFLPPSRCFIVWDKMTYIPSMSQIELAWTSFDKNAQLKKINSNQINRIHPTQKPLKLYEWILSVYAEKGQRILDTHVGSGNSRVACYLNGLDFVGFEINIEYCQLSEKLFEDATSQQRLSF